MLRSTVPDLIVERLKAASIGYEQLPDMEGIDWRIAIEMPNGKKKRRVFCSASLVSRFEQANIESTVFLGDFDAIHDQNTGVIEAAITPLNSNSSFRLSRLFPRPERIVLDELDDEENLEFDDEVVEESEIQAILSTRNEELNLCVEIAQSSKTFECLISRAHRSKVLRISGVTTSRHNEALSILTKLSNGYLFSLDLGLNLSFSLRKQRKPILRRIVPRTISEEQSINFPTREFDSDPMSLYMYGLSARGMPLLEFLALYQVLEYYFPIFSKKEAGRQIKTIVKDPTFSADREADIGRILTALASSNRGGIGNERQQLKATLDECVIESELLSFLTEYEAREKFFSRSQKQLSDQKLLFGKPLQTSTQVVSEAIYDIRCKIVHSKAEEANVENGRLLPFSEEVELLNEYLPLLRFLAQKALIASSTRLAINN